MRVLFFLLFCGLFLGRIASAQPAIYPRGVLNAASSAPAGLPNGSIAQGSLFEIYGASLGPATGSQVTTFPLATTFQNVSITVGQGAKAVKAIPYYVSAGQVAAIMPSNAPLGLQPIYVTYNGAVSNPSPVNVVATSFSFFTFNGEGFGPAAAVNASSGATFNSPQATVKPGQVVVAFGTGLGPIATPDNEAAPGFSPTTPIQIFVGGVVATVAYSGRAPGVAGEDQINFTIPANAPTGCWVPVYAVANGITSNAVTLSIDANGAPCSDPANPLAQPFVAGKKLATILLLHSDTLQDTGVNSTVEVENDVLVADFATTPATPWPFARLFSQPPPGACTLLQQVGDAFATNATVAGDPETPLGVATSFSVKSANSLMQVSPPTGSTASAFLLGSAVPAIGTFPSQLFLSPGEYTVQAPASAAIGAVQASVTMPAPFTWTGRANLLNVPRSTPLTLNWTGLGANQYMAIYGGDADLKTNSSAIFYCLAPLGASTFTIPAEILAAIPYTRDHAFRSKSVIYLWSTPVANGTPFQVQGIDNAYAIGAYAVGKTVIFQ